MNSNKEIIEKILVVPPLAAIKSSTISAPKSASIMSAGKSTMFLTILTTTAITNKIDFKSNSDHNVKINKVVKKEKTKRKNSEKRKEKSRKAARERRSQEAKIFDEIEEILPVSAKILDHLDKASLVRIAINYLKIRSVVNPLKVPETPNDSCGGLSEDLILNTLNGFIMVLSKDGGIIYLSENVERFLGLSQIDFIGQNLYEYSHPCDHDDIKSFLEPLTNAFNASKNSNSISAAAVADRERSEKSKKNSQSDQIIGPFFLRMKCTLTNKGRNLNLKSANYKVIKCRGRMIDLESIDPVNAKSIGEHYRHYMIAIAELIQHPIMIDTPLKSDVFVSKHSPDMKFVSVDESIKELFGYDVEDLIGTSFYQYLDGNDFNQLSILFKTLFSKGQCDFEQYKFLAKHGGHRWISTQATVINEPNSNQPQSIILVHRIISNFQDEHILTSAVQTPRSVPEEKHSIEPIKFATTQILNQSIISSTSSVIRSNVIVEKNKFSSSIENKLPKLTSNVIFNENISSVPSINSKQQIKNKDVKISTTESLAQKLTVRPLESITDQFVSSTETVLAPKTADMESGFLVFTDDNKSLTVINDADDLTHLAPDAGDLCVPMLPDMDFADMNIFDEMFFNSSSYNITNQCTMTEDEFLSNLGFDDNGKLKINGLNNSDHLAMEFDNTSSNSFKEFNQENLLGLQHSTIANQSKAMRTSEVFEQQQQQQYPLDVSSNDPFLSFTNAHNNDDFLLINSPKTNKSDCSLNDSFVSHSPSNSLSSHSTSSSLQYSPKSISFDESNSSATKLCDNSLNDFENCDEELNESDEDKDLEMRAPFIPIDDDYLLNDFNYSNIDDLFDWISHKNINNSNNECKREEIKIKNSQQSGNIRLNGKKNRSSELKVSGGGGCLEALLQNDELIWNLKNKIFSSNQILNRDQCGDHHSNQMTSSSSSLSSTSMSSSSSAKIDTEIDQNLSNRIKSKNNNIYVYTTMTQSGEKKIKNLILSPEIPGNKLLLNGSKNDFQNRLTNTSPQSTSVHHFVLTKNNELIPKMAFVNQNQSVSNNDHRLDPSKQHKFPKRSINDDNDLRLPVSITDANDFQLKNQMIKENFKKSRHDSMKNFSNSVLLNLLVKGSDLSNGYELID
ncbi:Hypoxia-inducible factor 1-alpha [Sarcoptes scabiei]|uniref:Hypoxia-inducible factor 1-alpha n=1 Tax=Sarcoptes scabiei TaxID=52283 RepID=A0A834R4C6_SARSC|nr:Hypoxia-inducible factor 1-alpha [Sarcoptes scabiei]